MKKLFLMLVILLGGTAAGWAVPQYITYQGTIKQKGIPLTGPLAMQFTFVNADGTAIPGALPISTNVVVTNGLFAVQLALPSGIDWSQLTPAIKVSIGSQQLSPSQLISSNLYSIVSQSVVDGAITQSKLAPSVQAGFIPAGAIMPFAGPNPPTGWLLCDGSAVSRTTYANLFTVIGTVWGTGDGTTTFNLPDLRGKTPIGSGQGVGLTYRVLGSTSGEEYHTLSISELPSHSHSANSVVTDPGHSHRPLSSPGSDGPSFPNYTIPGATTATGTNGLRTSVETTGITVQTSIGDTGGGAAHNVMQPSAVVTYIIKY